MTGINNLIGGYRVDYDRMMIPLRTPEMDMSNKTLILLFLIIYINCVSGLDIPQPDNVQVDILDGEVQVRWNQPVGAPSNCQYNVQMANYSGGEWAGVDSCTGITNTYCDLTSLIYNYGTRYKVRVQLVAGNDRSMSQIKKFFPNLSKLRPPTFTLWPTSSTLTVYVHQKPFLRKVFPYGPAYTIYLEERGQDKNIIAYLKDDVEEDQRAKTFISLHWGREYCVTVKVEGVGALPVSDVSNKQCVRLPEREWFIIAVSSLSLLVVLTFVAIMAAILLCYLKRPEKTPATLESLKSGHLPLSVKEGPMEPVTDKAWVMYPTQVKNCAKDPVIHVTVTEDNGEEDRRTSMDSGVGMESNSSTNSGGNPVMRQEDSGCGSLGVPESSSSSHTDYHLQKKRTDANIARKREDSGVGLGCQLHSSSMTLDGQDSGSLKEAVSGGSYRSQSPSDVQIHVCDDEEDFKLILPETVLAEVVTGYRAGPQSCICSGAGQCTWCHKQSLYTTRVIKQYRSMCIDNGLLSGKCDFVDSYKAGLTFSGYSKKTKMDTIMVDDLDTTFIQLGETFPLLTALTPLPLVEGGQDFNMNNVSLSLCDVQLTTD